MSIERCYECVHRLDFYIEKESELESDLPEYMHMSESEKEDNPTFDEVHDEEKTIYKIPLAYSKHIKTIDEHRNSPGDHILCLGKAKQFISNCEHPTAIDQCVDTKSIERIVRSVPESKTRKCYTYENLIESSHTK